MTIPYNPEIYWDKVAESITSRKDTKVIAGDDEPFYRYKRKRFLEVLNSFDFTNKKVLEIGSGPGGNLDFLYHKGCRKLTGVDISGQMISIANELLKDKGIDIIKINGKDLPFEDKSFDTVFTSTVLQHNTNEDILKELIKEICRVSADEVLLFERIESRIKGHESNLGRPIRYYESLLNINGFTLVGTRSLPIQASYYFCGIARRILNPKLRKEGEPLSKLSIIVEKLSLPLTSLLDKLIPSKRDVMLMNFKRKNC